MKPSSLHSTVTDQGSLRPGDRYSPSRAVTAGRYLTLNGTPIRTSSAERSERHRVAQLCYGWDVVFVRLSRFARHQVGRSPVQHNLVCRRATRRRRFRRRTVRPERHSTSRQERDPGNDVVLGCVAMPADGRAGTVLVEKGHGERVGINTRPLGNPGAQWQQECRKRPSGCAIVRLPKNATRRRATTPCISKSANTTLPIASRSMRSSVSGMKSSR